MVAVPENLTHGAQTRPPRQRELAVVPEALELPALEAAVPPGLSANERRVHQLRVVEGRELLEVSAMTGLGITEILAAERRIGSGRPASLRRRILALLRR